ncbi:MAG: DNA-directed RNA polymerase subunit alpha [Minisyncoccia bacterium]
MSEHQIVLPSKPRIIKEDGNKAVFEIDGFYPGYGHTIGNSLRRIILSSLPGVAITGVKIDGAPHEFSTVEGVKEDVITLLLNLKRVRFMMTGEEKQKLTLSVTGGKMVTASDISLPGQVEVMNPDQYICELAPKKKLEIEFTIEKGIGFIAKEIIHKDRVEIGAIALDAAFSPIRRVNYEVENMRVGDRTDFNRLKVTLETDGTIAPKDALEKSIDIMIHQLKAIVGFKEETLETPVIETNTTPMTERDEAPQGDMEVLKMRVDELSLTPRVAAVIDEAGIRTLGGLVRKREEDLLAIQGLGQKGVQEIKKALSEHGIALRA